GRADAAGGEHALALDLHHAGAAVAVRPVAGLGRVTQVRDVDAEALRRLPDGLAGLDVDLAPVEREGLGGRRAVVHRKGLSLTNVPAAFPVRPGNILARTAAGWAPPGRGRRSTHRAWRPRVRRAAPDSTARPASASRPSRCRPGRACTGRSSRPRRTASG